MHNINFLKKEDITGENALQIFKNTSPKTRLSDLCIILGAYVEDKETKNKTGWYWTKSKEPKVEKSGVIVIDPEGLEVASYCNLRDTAARPVLTFENENNIPNTTLNENKIEEITYGEYPQTVADEEIAKTLEINWLNNKLKKTNKEYVFDSRTYKETKSGFAPIKCDEYEFQGNKYIRVKINPNIHNNNYFILSNNKKYFVGDFVWIKVEPITWLKESTKNIFVSKVCLYSGIQFDKENANYNGEFDKTFINYYNNNFFKKEIIPSKSTKEKKTVNEFIYIDDQAKVIKQKRIIAKIKK